MSRAISREVEMLARMWIECDPNRGSDPDELAELFVDGVKQMRPRWEWFVPRAEASLLHFAAAGFSLVQTIRNPLTD